MNSITKSPSAPRRLAVRWIDHSAVPLPMCWRKARPFHNSIRLRRSPLHNSICLFHDFRRGARGFTLLEMMVVLAIIGFLAAVALPHVAGFNRANGISAATRQLLDDCALARQRAIANRSTVYMVFVPPQFYTNQALNGQLQSVQQTQQLQQQITNLLVHQYASYALLTLRTVGDQPGQHFPHYLTDWRTLPQGVFVAPFQFISSSPPLAVTINTTNTLSGSTTANPVYPFNWVSVPFPSISYGATMAMPCIAFTPEGTLTSTFTNQYIMLDRGSIFYPEDTNGVYQYQAPLIVETPPGNESNNPCMIQLDWLTARGNVVQNQFQ
jgi:prepilin-type N-terminal cleavage/methylation domain-containing protein